jgi:hypothetical protein
LASGVVGASASYDRVKASGVVECAASYDRDFASCVVGEAASYDRDIASCIVGVSTRHDRVIATGVVVGAASDDRVIATGVVGANRKADHATTDLPTKRANRATTATVSGAFFIVFLYERFKTNCIIRRESTSAKCETSSIGMYYNSKQQVASLQQESGIRLELCITVPRSG